jgi:hypothetical protein
MTPERKRVENEREICATACSQYLFHGLYFLAPLVCGGHQREGLTVQALHQVRHHWVAPFMVLFLNKYYNKTSIFLR